MKHPYVHLARLILALGSLCGIYYFTKVENSTILAIFGSCGWITVLVMLGEEKVRSEEQV